MRLSGSSSARPVVLQDLDSRRDIGFAWPTRGFQMLRAIDLYSGIGGWSVGLRLAGIDVLRSYEINDAACETNRKNNHHHVLTTDIRKLNDKDLPSNVDIVVGSPPCTEFSFSNRGGQGNLADGLADIRAFLRTVQRLKPKYWVFENVPRLQTILAEELHSRGKLRDFRDMKMESRVYCMSTFGVPQRRKRCIVGNINFALLESYATKSSLSLKSVLDAFEAQTVTDPIYGTKTLLQDVTDHVIEYPLSSEEARINRAAKTLHPIYNMMSFPERTDRPVRTITATCTRVSRESIIIQSAKTNKFRRLTVRERATLQGFPVSFQVFGNGHTQKMKMVGNALPPPFAYFVANAIQEVPASRVKALSHASKNLHFATERATSAKPGKPSKSHPAQRRFRFALPSLHMKSGVRFELANSFTRDDAKWEIAFYFGHSKKIETIPLTATFARQTIARLPKAARSKVMKLLSPLKAYIAALSYTDLQRSWARQSTTATSPFELLDQLDDTARSLLHLLHVGDVKTEHALDGLLAIHFGRRLTKIKGIEKLRKNAAKVLAGFVIGSVANVSLDKGHSKSKRKLASQRMRLLQERQINRHSSAS